MKKTSDLGKQPPRHPISYMLHHKMAAEVHKFTPLHIVDIGGTGKFIKWDMLKCPVTNANIHRGIDGCNLPYKDQQFDVSVSVAVIEHVADHSRFLKEAYRVARKASIHWFPVGHGAQQVEDLKRHHPCIIYTRDEILDILREMGGSVKDYAWQTCREHLLLLATYHDYLNTNEIYDLLTSCNEDYGRIFIIER